MRTRHVWASPGQHVWVHRHHCGKGGGNSDGDFWWALIKLILIIAVWIAVIVGVLYVFAEFWPIIALLIFGSVFRQVFGKK